MDNVVVIAGGAWQIFLVAFLKAKGHRVWVVNPVASETVRAADHHIPLNIRDTDAIVKYIQANDLDPLFVTSDQSDLATYSVALVSQALGLPGNDPESVRLYSDKADMYCFARANGIPVADFAEAADEEAVRQFLSTHDLPVIVKPTRSTASRGFAKITDKAQIARAVVLARKYSPNGRFIVQVYVGGPTIRELTAEGLCAAGVHRTLTTGLRDMCQPGINSALHYPSGLPTQRLQEANDRFVHATRLQFGLTHAEYFLDTASGDFWLTEIACRGGGVGIASHVVPWVSGFDSYEILYQNLRSSPAPPPDRWLSRPALIQFFHRHEMEPLSAQLVADLQRLGGVFFHNYRRHDFLPSEPDDLNSRHSLAILLRDSQEEIERDLRSMRQLIAHVVDRGAANKRPTTSS
jgi:biotin carboxylase